MLLRVSLPLQQRQPHRTHHTSPNHNPPGGIDLRIRHHTRRIPRQMPQPIQRMKGKRQRKEKLRGKLQGKRPSRERCSHRRALQVPAGVRGDEVRGAEEVEGAAEDAAGDAVHDRRDPRYLPLVDAQVRRDGAVEALLGEDFGVLAAFGDGGCCCCSVGGCVGG